VTNHVASLAVDAGEMSKRVYVPRSVFVASAVGVGLVNLLLSLVPLLAIIVLTGHPIHLSWLILPVSLAIGTCFTAGVALSIFTLSCRFVDARETYNALLAPWFFVTPIVYTTSILPERFRLLVRLNPMTSIIEVFRAPLYDGWLPGPNALALAVAMSLAMLTLGWLFYASRIDDYAARFWRRRGGPRDRAAPRLGPVSRAAGERSHPRGARDPPDQGAER
jgi:ABC-type polysaccharide/polyol phosphate export permease